jgi:hypothetical protein
VECYTGADTSCKLVAISAGMIPFKKPPARESKMMYCVMSDFHVVRTFDGLGKIAKVHVSRSKRIN